MLRTSIAARHTLMLLQRFLRPKGTTAFAFKIIGNMRTNMAFVELRRLNRGFLKSSHGKCVLRWPDLDYVAINFDPLSARSPKSFCHSRLTAELHKGVATFRNKFVFDDHFVPSTYELHKRILQLFRRGCCLPTNK